MGTESFIINHQTKQIFSVRGFWRYEENDLRKAVGSKELLSNMLKDFSKTEDHHNWLVNEIYVFCEGAEPEQINLGRDDEHDEINVIFGDALMKTGEYRIVKDIFDYEHGKGLWVDFYTKKEMKDDRSKDKPKV